MHGFRLEGSTAATNQEHFRKMELTNRMHQMTIPSGFTYFCRSSILWCLLVLSSGHLWSQDPHFSQTFMAPLYLNPALTATSQWDIRVGGQWKEQWPQVPVAYRTFAAFYDQKIDPSWLSTGRLGVGLLFLHDQAGDGDLSWTQVGLRASYTLPLGPDQALSAGVGADVGQRAFRADQLQFGDQYNGEFFDPDQTTTEVFNSQSSGLASLVAGLHYQGAISQSRSQLNVGLAASHFNRPVISFFGDRDVPLPVWARGYAQGQLELNEDWDATLRGHYFRQGAYQEILLGGGVQYYGLPAKQPIVLGAALAHRLGDAWIVELSALYQQQWRVGISYDINTSAFQTATNGRGGLELAVHYYIMQAKPPVEFKSCPIF
ncbi:MAG: hypothetical protein DA408_12585 [Bacteroidetes bacterium]|nr:MAG: hypothetical protein C7N36_17905 [Bacteroidota bacterium]PTM11863.1 MAG: hypothetical protein DA408_12585 [Bacteroidota bacterium]